MEQEYLKQLKEKLGNLSFEESLLRDLYLKGLATGEIQGPPVGYSSIDKPWLQYYDDNMISEQSSNISIYDSFIEHNKDHLNEVVFEYYGKNVTYEEMFSNIEKIASSYQEMGVKAGDVVTICSITTPEVLYSMYALNKIGAISNMVDVRYTKTAIENYLKEVNSKVFVTLDLCYPKINSIIENTSVDKVVTISPINSTPQIVKMIAKLSDYFKNKNPKIPFGEKYIEWNEFIKKGEGKKADNFEYKKDYPAFIVHTGGTTGVPKGVVLTNDNLNNAVIQIKSVINERGYRFLDIMPPFIAYGLWGILAPTILGWKTIIVPQFDSEKFDELLLKYKPNGVMGVPTYWEPVMKSDKVKKTKLNFLKNILIGGDKITAEFETRLKEFAVDFMPNAEISKGYSMTEVDSITTFSSKKANELGSVGAPLAHTIVAAFEPGTTKELKPYELGEICIKTPTMMKEYYKNEEATTAIKIKHEDGYWIHSGDIGYVDDKGIVFIKDRIKRMISRSGFKVWPSEIENLFMKCEAVESCAIVGIPDEVDVTVPKAHVVLKEEYKEQEDYIKEELYRMIEESEIPPYFKPVDIKFRKALPLTDIGKIDFTSLENEDRSNEHSRHL